MLLVLGLVLINIAFIYSEENDIYKITQVAWFEVTMKNYYGSGLDYREKFSIGLFGDIAPMKVLNFASLTKGYKTKTKKIHYLGTKIHRIVKDFIIQMGDVLNADGTGGMSIYGPKFDDEAFILSHRGSGWVSMANYGPDSNSSQFFILLTKARWLDGKHVVFGKVINGYDVITTISEAHTFGDTSTPAISIVITDCGVETLERPYMMTSSDLDSTENIQI